MPETHPDETELLELVEGERPELAAHVAACADCAERVRLLEAGRDVLRSAPLLELPADRRADLVGRLPAHERERRFAWRPLAVVVALAAVVAALAALAVVGSNGSNEEAGGAAGGGQEVSSPSADEGAVTGARAQPLATVAGDPDEVAASLRAKGFDARARRGRVLVLSAEPAAVRAALEPRRKGDVRVFVRNP